MGYARNDRGLGFHPFGNPTAYTLNQLSVYADGSLYGAGGTTAQGVFSDADAIWTNGNGITLAPGDSYTGSFAGGDALATFAIDALATWGIPADGRISMDYELYDNTDPNDPIWISSGTLIAQYLGIDAIASVNIPEPSTFPLFALGTPAMWLAGRRRNGA